jgi:hypothetical protein
MMEVIHSSESSVLVAFFSPVVVIPLLLPSSLQSARIALSAHDSTNASPQKVHSFPLSVLPDVQFGRNCQTNAIADFLRVIIIIDRLCGLVVRVSGC